MQQVIVSPESVGMVGGSAVSLAVPPTGMVSAPVVQFGQGMQSLLNPGISPAIQMTAALPTTQTPAAMPVAGSQSVVFANTMQGLTPIQLPGMAGMAPGMVMYPNASGMVPGMVPGAVPIMTALPMTAAPLQQLTAAQPQTSLPQPVAPSRVLTRGGDTNRYRGAIKSFFDGTGFGFIECPEVKAKYGHDVFLHRQQCASHTVGQKVEFNIEPNKQGKPQARFLTAIDGTSEQTSKSRTRGST